MTDPTNLADAEAEAHRLTLEPDDDRPPLADCVDTRPVLAPWPKACGGSWATEHRTPASVADCPFCAPGWDEPPC